MFRFVAFLYFIHIKWRINNIIIAICNILKRFKRNRGKTNTEMLNFLLTLEID